MIENLLNIILELKSDEKPDHEMKAFFSKNEDQNFIHK